MFIIRMAMWSSDFDKLTIPSYRFAKSSYMTDPYHIFDLLFKLRFSAHIKLWGSYPSSLVLSYSCRL